MILDVVPEAVVNGNVGRRSSFEIKVNNKLIFSKLHHFKFPKPEAIIEQVQNAVEGREVREVTETLDSNCSIQ